MSYVCFFLLVFSISANCPACRYMTVVTDDPGSKPDQKYAWRRDKRNYIRKIKQKFRNSSKKNSKLIHWEGANFKVFSCCKVYDGICYTEGFGLLLAKGCGRITALTPGKRKHSLKLSAYISRTAVCA